MSVSLNKLFQDVKPSPMLRMFEASSKYQDLISLGIGEPDLATDARIIDAADKAGRDGFTHYPPLGGYPDLRAAISQVWHKKYGLESEADDVVIGIGATQVIFMLLQALIDPGDEVIVPDPGFTPYSEAIDYVYGKPVYVQTLESNGFNMTADSLEKAITPKTKVVFVNSPGNPTGATLDRAEALKICEVIKKHDLILFSDEVYEAFLYEGEHVCLATLPGMKERTFTIGSFSKTYSMCGWRVGYAIGPRKVISTTKIINIGTAMGVNAMAQRAALYALNNCDDFIENMVAEFKKRAYYAADRVNNIKGLSCLKPKGSFYLFANISQTGLKSLDFCLKLLEEARVVTIPGISFGPTSDDYVRIAYTIPVPKLEQAFDKIEKALK